MQQDVQRARNKVIRSRRIKVIHTQDEICF